jgi:hypothetical protein
MSLKLLLEARLLPDTTWCSAELPTESATRHSPVATHGCTVVLLPKSYKKALWITWSHLEPPGASQMPCVLHHQLFMIN